MAQSALEAKFVCQLVAGCPPHPSPAQKKIGLVQSRLDAPADWYKSCAGTGGLNLKGGVYNIGHFVF